jgi:hypothetical protein
MIKNKINNDPFTNITVCNVNKNYLQYYIPIFIIFIIVIIINICIYLFLTNNKKEKEAAFIEGSEIAIKRLIENDLKLISNQCINLGQLSILKNHSDVTQTKDKYNIVGSVLYAKQSKKSIVFDLQPLVFLMNSILAQNFYYQISFNNHILATNVGDELFHYVKKYQVNKESVLAIKLIHKTDSVFLQKNLQYLKNQILAMVAVSTVLFLLASVLTVYLVGRQKRRYALCNARLVVEGARELNLRYIKACQDLDSNDFLPISLPVFNKYSGQIKVDDITEEVKTRVLAYTASFHYKFKLDIISEISSINIKYDVTIFKRQFWIKIVIRKNV